MFVDIESASILKEPPKGTPKNLRPDSFPVKIFSLSNKQEFLDYLDGLVSDLPQAQIDILKDMQGDDYAKPYWNIIEDEKRERE